MMHATPIVSCGPLARIDGFRGVVHAAFPSSVYLAPQHGLMMVLHDVAHGHTPTSVLVRDPRALNWSFRCGDVVTGRIGQLRVNHSLFDARQAPRWHPPPPPCAATSLASWIRSSQSQSHLRRRVPDSSYAQAEARLGPGCRHLITALAGSDGAQVQNALRSLIGNGPGLTPSGDDAVVGILAVLHRAQRTAPVAVPLSMLGRHVPAVLHRTTPLSAHYLNLALQGHFGEHLTRLIDACLTTGPEDLDLSLVIPVLRTGATSGADVLIAVTIALSFMGYLRQTGEMPAPQAGWNAA